MSEETTAKSPDQANPRKVDQSDPEKVSEDVALEQSEAIPNPAAGESKTPSAAEEHAPSRDDPQATDIPTQDAPDPEANNPALDPNAAGEKVGATTPAEAASQSATGADSESKTAKPPAQVVEKKDEEAKANKSAPAAKTEKTEDVEKPAAKAKPAGKTDAAEEPEEEKKPAAKAAAKKAEASDESKGKPDAKAGAKKPKKEAKPSVEDKPFADFIQQDFLPTLEKDLAKRGIGDLQLTFENSQVTGRWSQGQRQFTVYFPEEDIQGRKAFSWAANGTTPSTLEPFLSDERKITLDLLVFYVLQRLNAQKWLGGN